MKFKFRLQKLLELRRRELQQVDSRIAEVAARAADCLRNHAALQGWLAERSTSDMAMTTIVQSAGQQAIAALQEHERWEQQRQEHLVERTKKQQEVEALEQLESEARAEHVGRQRRRETEAIQEHSLRQWAAGKSQGLGNERYED